MLLHQQEMIKGTSFAKRLKYRVKSHKCISISISIRIIAKEPENAIEKVYLLMEYHPETDQARQAMAYLPMLTNAVEGCTDATVEVGMRLATSQIVGAISNRHFRRGRPMCLFKMVGDTEIAPTIFSDWKSLLQRIFFHYINMTCISGNYKTFIWHVYCNNIILSDSDEKIILFKFYKKKSIN